ncbi:MAG: amino acid adenylation domain-containing protein [Blastocatellia bacterium]
MRLFAEPTSDEFTPSAKEYFLLHQFFQRSARLWPRRAALDIPPGINRPDRRVITYAELEQQSDALACLLRAFVTKECVVAILLSRHTEHLYSSQLGVLKAGAAYTCIDVAFPDEQVRNILEDAKPVALLTDSAGLARAENFGIARELVFDVADFVAQTQALAPAPPDWLAPDSLAYIIYTSGTTGRPKGVMIEHKSIANLVGSDIEEFRLSPDDRIGQSSSAAYDSSLEEIWLGFAAGATVVVIDDDTARLGPDLIPWLQGERITVLCPPPTLLRTTSCEDPETALPDLSLLYVGGEALPTDVADRWSAGRRMVNGYGPTECTVTALRGPIRPGEPITIGSPVRGLESWVLNESLEEVSDGEQGELCLGGIGLARGYHNQPDLTAQKFLTHPVFGRIYRTGDLVHRDGAGLFFYHGRIDSQVKLRGYRIELEAIESRLAEADGVREAICSVQVNGSQQTLVAFIVPDEGREGLSFDDLKTALRKVLPGYMIPSRFALLTELPKTVGGKLNRKALPIVETQERACDNQAVVPRTEMEKKIETAFRKILRAQTEVSIRDDFFNDLGGDSLNAAQLISLLRNEPSTKSITVRDLYESRTVEVLAKRAHTEAGPKAIAREQTAGEKPARPLLVITLQNICLLIGVIFVSSIAYSTAFHVTPFLIRRLGLIELFLLGPLILLLALTIYTPVAVLLAVGIKRVLIGRYRALRAPVWGNFYVRNWIVQQAVRIVPWRLFEGTLFQILALRALGARIGERVHIHRGVNLLHGGWDLLDIGDDVTISQDASLRLVDLDGGQVVVGSVTLGNGSTLEVRAGVGSNTVLEPEASLSALSSLPDGGRIPRGEHWHGIPAEPDRYAPPVPELTEQERISSPFGHAVALSLSRFGLELFLALSLALPLIAIAFIYGIDRERALNWFNAPKLDISFLVTAVLILTLSVPIKLMLEALAMRAMGRVRAGVISHWSMGYVRVWLKTRIVNLAGRWLSGTLMWPVWLRLAGMKIGRGCEISTIIDVVPELIEIGGESFFADGIYLGGPQIHRGTVTLAQTVLGRNAFLGNHVVIECGQRLPESVLLGVCTVADDKIMRGGTSWFGHPPFELPRREIVECDRSLTHAPSLIRYLDRLFWELLRFGLPVIPLLALPVLYKLMAIGGATYSTPVFMFAIIPLLTLGAAVFFCLLVLALKWGLLGRVRPGIHPLWSCWCSRWDFLYVAWSFYAGRALAFLEGTLLLVWYLRAMGAQIGRGVILGSGFAQVVDPDMLHFEDGATVSCQFQAHTFEDRVLKIDHVRIRGGATVGSAAVLLYGADIGDRSRVAPHSVVMKRETLLPGHSYAGCPTRPVQT